MRRWVTAIAIAVGVVLPSALPGRAVADDWAPSHHCSRPVKPFRFTSEFEIRSYANDVEEYERCIDDFVQKQKAALEAHREAMRKAVSEWNQFVQFELK